MNVGQKLILLAVMVAACGCAAVHKSTQVNEYIAPPKIPNLEEVFLSLPDRMVADMPLAGRKIFLKHEADDVDPTNKRFDPANGFIHYFADSDEGTGAASMLYLKVLPTSDGSYIVVIHIPKPFAGIHAPSDLDTYILRPSPSDWIDVTTELLPKNIPRNWYFLPQRKTSIIEAGPNIETPRRDGRGVYWNQVRKFDLLWNGNRFEAKPSSTKEFTYE